MTETAQREIRKDQQDLVATNNYTNLEALEKREFRATQLTLLKDFLLTKKLEGCTMNTIRAYHDCIKHLIDWTIKDIRELDSKDIRTYLYQYQESRNISSRTLNNMRLTFSSFYSFLEIEDYITKNPVRQIRSIKYDEIVRQPFTDEELEQIRNACKNIRDLAIVDLLYSTGMRIGECISLNIRDLNFAERELIVLGKGGKERICFFNARTKIEILEYLRTRNDRDSALFVQAKNPHERLEKSGVRHILKDIEARSGVTNVHPHRFRRTLATNLLDKGMSLEQVQMILGHKKIETTLIYAKINTNMAKLNHQKYTC